MKACPFCAEEIQDEAKKCRHGQSWLDEDVDHDDRGSLGPPPPGGLVMVLLPVGRSGWAIAAGYPGLLACLCIPAPIAILVAMRALRDLKGNPHQGGAGRAYFGLIAGIVGTLALAALALLGRLPHEALGPLARLVEHEHERGVGLDWRL